MAVAKSTEKTLHIGDMATFEVVIPNCGLEKGYRKKMRLTRELQECIENGLWKVRK